VTEQAQTLFPVDERGQEAEPKDRCLICGELCHGRYCSEHDPATAPIPY
jgi:hypothetical protein